MTLWLHLTAPRALKDPPINLDLEPSPTIMAARLAACWREQYYLTEDDRMPPPVKPNKPPFRIPSMAEINAIPWNGLTVASTFSGTGGSCLGYRMAGFKVIWANEFVPEAQASYKANAAPGSIMDGRDIKLVTARQILAATGLAKGELDIFDGSPPCQAFSTAGSRERGWGKDKHYEHGARQKNETLFDEYIRLLRGLQPKVFIAENVSGLVKGTAKGFFLDILRELKASGYRVESRLLDAQWLDVPQARQRIIFMGVRNDLSLKPVFPKPLPYRYSVRDALPWIGRQKLGGKENNWTSSDRPSPTIGASDHSTSPTAYFSGGGYVEEVRDAVKREPSLTLIMGAHGWFPGRVVEDHEPAPTVLTSGFGADYKAHVTSVDGKIERRKFTIAELKPICGFPDDFVLTGSYADQWARLGNSVPPVMMAKVAAAVRDGVLLPLQRRKRATTVAPNPSSSAA